MREKLGGEINSNSVQCLALSYREMKELELNRKIGLGWIESNSWKHEGGTKMRAFCNDGRLKHCKKSRHQCVGTYHCISP